MDEALKARLIGAVVLVLLAVLLIPELLSGRKPAGAEDGASVAERGARTFTIELAGSAPTPAERPTPVPGTAPARTTGATPDAAQDSAPATQAGKPAERTAAPDAGAPAPAASQPGPNRTTATPAARPPAAAGPVGGGWAVQVGAFSSAATAEKMADQLRSAGFRAYISPVSRSGKTLQRVRVGPEAERARAEGLAASLKARGLPATVVAND